MAEARLRIFSDLHFRDPRGLLHDTAAFAPLLADADRVVLNGDSLDTQIPALARHRGELRAFFDSTGRDVRWLSGNHDPDISPESELSLRDDRVWITHGDVFFDAIAPWSHHAPEIRRRLALAAAGLSPAEAARVETRLRLHRAASLALPEGHGLFHASPLARARLFVRSVFPPRRLLSMLDAWRSTPGLVARLVREQRPRARLVVLGHTHYPGVWRPRSVPGLVVVNTGSFTRPFGGLTVELEGERVRVARIRRSGSAFAARAPFAEFTLPPG